MQSMRVISLTCDKCGAPLEVGEKVRFFTCAFCGSRLAMHHAGGAVYTEALGRIDEKTDRILTYVQQLLADKELLDAQADAEANGLWETCEIMWDSRPRNLFSSYLYFLAKSTGPDRPYIVAESEVSGYDLVGVTGSIMVPRMTEQSQRNHEELVQELQNQGWVEHSRGEHWFNIKFRRVAAQAVGGGE